MLIWIWSVPIVLREILPRSCIKCTPLVEIRFWAVWSNRNSSIELSSSRNQFLHFRRCTTSFRRHFKSVLRTRFYTMDNVSGTPWFFCLLFNKIGQLSSFQTIHSNPCSTNALYVYFSISSFLWSLCLAPKKFQPWFLFPLLPNLVYPASKFWANNSEF